MGTETTETVVKPIYCTDSNNSALLASLMNNQNNPAEMMAMMNSNGWNNNPFVWIVFMMMMRYWNNDGMNGNSAENFNSRQIAALQDTMNNDHNNQVVLDAMSNNQSAIRELAQTFNTDISNVQAAISSVNTAISNVAGQVGFSAERVINAVNLGDQNITSKLCECCCNTQKAILTQGYEGQLATERQTGILGSKIDGLQSANQLGQFQMQSALGNQINDARNAMVSGFAQVGYAASENTNAIIQAANANTQRVIDQLNNHWVAETSQALQDAKGQISQLQQTQTILNAINGGCQCNS